MLTPLATPSGEGIEFGITPMQHDSQRATGQAESEGATWRFSSVSGLLRKSSVARRLVRLALLFSVLFTTVVAGEDSFQVAVAAFDRGDYAEAFAAWKRLADAEDSHAQFNVGLLCETGLAVKESAGEAFIWFHRAAKQDLPKAQYMLGMKYWNSSKYEQAMEWLLKAAEGGEPNAQHAVGWRYITGPYVPWRDVIPSDVKRGVMWLRRAADAGLAMAQRDLASQYEKGEGVLQDYSEALRLYRLAAEQGHKDAQFNLGTMYLNGKGTKANLILAYVWFNIAAVDDGSTLRRVYPTTLVAEGRKLAESMMSTDDVEQAQALARTWRPRADANPHRMAIIRNPRPKRLERGE